MNCLICCEEITTEFAILNCECPYNYHNKCIKKWFKIDRSCPNCRKKWWNPFDNIPTYRVNRTRRNAINPEQAREIQRRLFLESIGVNSSRNTLNSEQYFNPRLSFWSEEHLENRDARLSPIIID